MKRAMLMPARGIAMRPVTMLLAAVTIAGCGTSPPETFHALTRYASDSQPVASAAGRYGVQIGPVAVPEAVNRPQLVIRTDPGRFDIKEQQRWAGPLPADIAQALAEDLTLALPQAYIYSQSHSPANVVPARFRVAVDVQRFESRLQGEGAGSLVEMAWVVTDVLKDRRHACRSAVQMPLQGKGYAALVQAHQGSLARISERVASVVSQLANGQESFSVPEGTVCLR